MRPPEPACDAEFLRRVYLDLAGRIPSMSEAESFLDDSRREKRRELVSRLLDSPSYVNHFTTVWRALLLPEAASSPELQGQAAPFDVWLRKQIATNVPYDRMVRELLTFDVGESRAQDGDAAAAGSTDSAGVLSCEGRQAGKPCGEHGPVVSRHSAGMRSQCHNHPFAQWKREQFWSYAAFFAGLGRQNQPDGSPGTSAKSTTKESLPFPERARWFRRRFLTARSRTGSIVWVRASRSRTG